MKIKFIRKITRWLYDISHDYTIADRNYHEERNKQVIVELNDKIADLEKKVDGGIIECKIVQDIRKPVSIRICDKIDLNFLSYDDCMQSVEAHICRKIGDYLLEHHLVTFKYNDDFHYGFREVYGQIDILQK